MPDTPKSPQAGPARTPLAMALLYEDGAAPRVVAKGRGAVAEKIIETAAASGVRIEENPILAEALSHVELDDHIPPELYRVVAEIISTVLRARQAMQRR